MKIAFLDRDGVINREVNYLHKIDEFQFTERCVEALKNIRDKGYEIAIVTNQAGIARGYYSSAQYQQLTDYYLGVLQRNGLSILEVKHCPHHPQGAIEELSIECRCRKPRPGMIHDVLKQYSVDPADCFMVGDKVSDMQAGANANIEKLYLVESGHPLTQEQKQAYATYPTLFELSLVL